MESLLTRFQIAEKTKERAYINLACSLVESAIKENDIWFFKSDFGIFIKDFFSDERLNKIVGDMILNHTLKTKRITHSAIECAKTLVDKDFTKLYSFFATKIVPLASD